MATTNLISKSLGDILTESGNGTPNHVSPKGSLYTNQDTGTLHINNDGVTGWTSMNVVSYGTIYVQENTTALPTGTMVANTWYSTSGLTWNTSIANNGFDSTGNVLTLQTGRDGLYEVIASATMIINVTGADYEVGISKNGASPGNGAYNGASVTSLQSTGGISIITKMNLTGGDTLSLSLRNINSTVKGILKHGGIMATRIGD